MYSSDVYYSGEKGMIDSVIVVRYNYHTMQSCGSGVESTNLKMQKSTRLYCIAQM